MRSEVPSNSTRITQTSLESPHLHTHLWLEDDMSDITESLFIDDTYRKVSNIRHTKSQNLNASRLILELSLPNPLKPGVKLRMKM